MNQYSCPVSWSDIPDEYRFRAMDANGLWWAHENRPIYVEGYWHCGDMCTPLGAIDFPSDYLLSREKATKASLEVRPGLDYDGEIPEPYETYIYIGQQRPDMYGRECMIKYSRIQSTFSHRYKYQVDLWFLDSGLHPDNRELDNVEPCNIRKVENTEKESTPIQDSDKIEKGGIILQYAGIQDILKYFSRKVDEMNYRPEHYVANGIACPLSRDLVPKERIEAKIEALEVVIKNLEAQKAEHENRITKLQGIIDAIDWKKAEEELQRRAVQAADQV